MTTFIASPAARAVCIAASVSSMSKWWVTARRMAGGVGHHIDSTGYVGSNDSFDRAMTRFAFTYADQNDCDYASFIAAIEDGSIEAADG